MKVFLSVRSRLFLSVCLILGVILASVVFDLPANIERTQLLKRSVQSGSARWATTDPLAAKYPQAVTYLKWSLDHDIESITMLIRDEYAKHGQPASSIGLAPIELSTIHLLKAEEATAHARHDLALDHLQQSLSLVPPHSADDFRYRLVAETAMRIVIANGCVDDPLSRVASLLVIYSQRWMHQPSTCIEKLSESLIQNLVAGERAYVLLRIARDKFERGQVLQANHLLELAEQDGLPAVWRLLAMREAMPVEFARLQSQIARDAIQPSFVLSDDPWIGYELDPIQVELGLPVDVLLFLRPGATIKGRETADVRSLVVNSSVEVVPITAVNLAPNPGFEYGRSEKCLFHKCMPLGFDTDIYNGHQSVEAYQYVEALRPIVPGKSWLARSMTMRLANSEILDKTNLQSFFRLTEPGRLYLQAVWARADDGRAYSGRLWIGDANDKAYDYVVGSYSSSEWMHFGQIVTAPGDARLVHLWLINYLSHGDVWFDGQVFIALPSIE